MNDRKKKVEITRWKIGAADGFQAMDQLETDEELAVAECYDRGKETCNGTQKKNKIAKNHQKTDTIE